MLKRHENKLQWALLVLVVLALAGYAIYSQLISVIPAYHNYDPETVYFMNSLGILDGTPYYYAEHPGTPVNLAGTLIVVLLKPLVVLQGHTDFITVMLLNPERFLLVARLFVALLNIAAVFYIWRFSRDKVSPAGLALILTAYFFALGAGLWPMTVTWTHNAFCFSLGTVYLFGVYRVLRGSQRRTYRQLAWLGVGAGFLLAIQLYFVAWVIGVLAVVICLLLIEGRSWRIVVRSISAIVGGTIASFFVVNLLILHRFPFMMNWFSAITKNLGRYGRGDPGVIALSVLWKNFVTYQQSGFMLLFGLVFALLVGFIVLAFRQRNFKAHKVLWASAGGFGIQTLLVCLLILKHPGVNYTVALAAMLPMLLFLWFSLHQPDGKLWAWFYVIAACLGLILFVGQFVGAVQRNDQVKIFQEARRVLVDDYLTEYAAQHSTTKDDLHVVIGYGAIVDWCWPLLLGHRWANNIYTDQIAQICQGKGEWNIWEDHFLIDDINMSFENYKDWGVIILQSDWGGVDFFTGKDVTVQQLDYGLTFVTP